MDSLENLGTEENPVHVYVRSDQDADRVERLCRKLRISTMLEIDETEEEDVSELNYVLLRDFKEAVLECSKPIDPKPNNFCPCSSGKKFKKCCMGQQLSAPA